MTTPPPSKEAAIDAATETLCKCGRPSHPNYGSRCEDCFADGAAHLYGRADRIAIVETVIEDVPMFEPFDRKKISKDKAARSASDNGK